MFYASTETIRTIRDGKPRTAALTFTQFWGSVLEMLVLTSCKNSSITLTAGTAVECCLASSSRLSLQSQSLTVVANSKRRKPMTCDPKDRALRSPSSGFYLLVSGILKKKEEEGRRRRRRRRRRRVKRRRRKRTTTTTKTLTTAQQLQHTEEEEE